MKSNHSYQIYSSTTQLPEKWNELAVATIFLSREYLTILEKSAPANMSCHFIGLFENENLVGIAVSQFLDLNQLESFGDRDQCIKSSLRNIAFKNFCSHILLIGNNTLTGQNAFIISENANGTEVLKTLKKAVLALKEIFKKRGTKVHLCSLKDFCEDGLHLFEIPEFDPYLRFTTQPNMLFAVRDQWKTEEDYVAALSKKYRDQYKRARKKGKGLSKRQLSLEEIIAQEEIIYDLYYHVAQSAPFNTFFLPKNHFAVFKEQLQENFLFYGYFENEKLIGFNTLIKNGSDLDTYFLGYDDSVQREKMLYLNMLYDMIGYAIKEQFKTIIFARTALEIKSSVGATPLKMYGMMRHDNKFINKRLDFFFRYLEPETIWKERHPFQE
ncbi:MAG: N-acetyltransferase [Flavobacterium sp.]|nr:N-acetyltransferase [Flavobacterium sp.]